MTTPSTIPVPVTFWSRAGQTLQDPALNQAAPGKSSRLVFEPAGRFYAGRLEPKTAGTLTFDLVSPRPLRIWLAGVLVLDEPLCWRSYEREVRLAVVFPCQAGSLDMRVEVGARPRHPEGIDRDCPSRNREHVMAEAARRHPDELGLTATLHPVTAAPAVSIRFLTAQFVRNGVTWQHVLARPIRACQDAPSTWLRTADEEQLSALVLSSSVLPRAGEERTSETERAAGLRRFYVPVAEPNDEPAPVRGLGLDARVEPSIEIARTLTLTVEGPTGAVALPLPAFESLGKLAPQREFTQVAWPTPERLRAGVPEPVLPAAWRPFEKLYYAAWDMLLAIVKRPDPCSGFCNDYISTGAGFVHHQFVWDTSFTAMATAYAWRAMSPYTTINLLYTRQFDGGYIHREHDVRDGSPALYEPDFSPNPPIMTIAEWQMARLTGNVLRLRQVYPALKANHAWLQHNRRLPDGTYWTTGLANGLDNSPSLGDGYPDLTAQMAHEAEILGRMATVLEFTGDAESFRLEHAAIGRALNEKLWSETMRIYSTSLPGGGHNTNKVVTAFWPLWAGIVPPDRVEALAGHLKDPKSFWRHHPIPSLAADSPHFQPGGSYWLGSTWAPTNYAAIRGFERAGRHDLAVEATVRHVQCMLEVFNETGYIWENYCSEASKRGNWSGSNYCWSSLGPVALLLEELLGLEADALANPLRWNPPADETSGVRRFPLGPATVGLMQTHSATGTAIDVETDRSFTLELIRQGQTRRIACPIGKTHVEV